jgi:hypothetical protein
MTFGLAIVPAGFAQQNPAQDGIPVVKTWKELQALPPIDLGDGIKVRLGLEADKVPQWSGALVYCLTEGYTPFSKWNGRGDPTGPVHVAFEFGDTRSVEGLTKWMGDDHPWPKGSYLFVRGLMADRIGDYQIRVTDDKGKLIAGAKWRGTKEFFHPWMPWLQRLDKPVMPWVGIALPNVDHHGPVAFVEPGKVTKGDLPTFFPDERKPSLTIKKNGNAIVIRAEKEFTTSRPDYHFLARWWVNDKPFVPKQTESLWAFDGYGLVSEDKEMRTEVDFRPERLGAKAGDKIGLQLMHAEGQWDWCAYTVHKKLGASKYKNGEPVRVSNRIEFVVPGKKAD